MSEGSIPDYLLNLSITNGLVSSTIYRKRDDFHLRIAKFPFLCGYGLPPLPMMYISRSLLVLREYSQWPFHRNEKSDKRFSKMFNAK